MDQNKLEERYVAHAMEDCIIMDKRLFYFFVFVPVLFKYHGPLLAGQMGMTWSLVVILGLVSSSWLSPKAPVFGILIAKKSMPN